MKIIGKIQYFEERGIEVRLNDRKRMIAILSRWGRDNVGYPGTVTIVYRKSEQSKIPFDSGKDVVKLVRSALEKSLLDYLKVKYV